MASNNPAKTTAADRGVVLQAPTIPGTSEGGGGSASSSGSSFSGIANEEAFAVLMDFIRQTAGGGTADQRRQREERNTQIQSARGTLGDYTKEKAFTDAADLMAQNLRQSLEKNMPVIARGIQGAGTSASSMQALLSQRLATESAQAAGALGADQAKAYGGISAQLQGVLEALTRIDPSIEANLLKALELTRIQTSSQSSSQTTNPTKATTASGGGSYFQPFQQEQDFGGSNGGSIEQSVINQALSPGQGYIVNNRTGQGTQFQGGSQTPIFVPSMEQSPEESDYLDSISQGFGETYW